MSRIVKLAAAGLVVAATVTPPSFAQTYPVKPIRLVGDIGIRTLGYHASALSAATRRG